MSYELKANDLLLNEFEVVKEIAEGQSELVSLYSSYVPRLVNRLERYFKMINKDGDMLDNIVEVLDKYNLVYAKSVVVDTLEKSKSHDFRPLRQNEEQIKIFKKEIEQIKQLEKHGAKQLAFALLVTSKVRTVRYADPSIYLANAMDIQRLCGKMRKKEETYFLLHDLAKAEMVTVPLIEDKLTVNFTRYEGEVEYTLTNTEVLDLLSVFNNVVGEYRSDKQKCILEISLVEDYHEVHNSINTAVEVHNQRYNKRVDKSAISKCSTFERMSAGDSAFIEWDWQDREEEEYIKQVCDFVRKFMKSRFLRVKKQGGTWVFTREFTGAVHKETGEVLFAKK